jgi:hypothetical protein
VLFSIAQQIMPPHVLEKYNSKTTTEPCIQMFLNAEPMACGNALSKKTKGIITASKDNINKIYFNITVKSNCGKSEPPVYLRFIKVKQMDIQELLQYTQDGDEIFIEEYIPATNKIDLSCSPANFYIQNPS